MPYSLNQPMQKVNDTYNGGYPINNHKSTDNSILIASGFPDDTTPHMIFRLFSLYGNVRKVKIMFK